MTESKSKVLIFGLTSKLKTVDYGKTLHIGSTRLNFVDKYKYLGITLDKYMNSTYLVSDVKKKVVSQLFKLPKLRNMIASFCAISLYKPTILPLFMLVSFYNR